MFKELIEVSDIIMDKCLGVESGENLLIVTDRLQEREINEALMTSASNKGAEASIIIMEPRKLGVVEAPAFVEEAMKSSNVVVLTPIRTVSYSRAVRNARKSGARVLGLTGINREIMLRSVAVDYRKLCTKVMKLADTFKKTKVVRITSPSGDNLKLELSAKREPLVVDGISQNKGEIDFLPPGYVSMAPIEGKAEGVYVANGSCNYFGVLHEPIKLTIKGGFVTKIEGGEQAKKYRRLLEGLEDPNAYNVGEIGIGLNHRAKLSGVTVEDERIRGGATLGVGQNILHGGRTEAKVHVDLITMGTTVRFDQEIIVEKGRFLFR